MKSSSFGWFRAAALGCALVLSACGSDSPPASCSPTCNAGYTCVSGNCVVLCNPPCSAGTSCRVVGAATACLPDTPGDGGTDDVLDVTQPTDTAPQDDLPPGIDMVTPPTDAVTPPTDTVTPPTDTVAGDSGVRAPCGATGQPCCSGYACTGNNACNRTMMRCEAFTPEAGECTTTVSCPAGQICALAGYCTMDTRACLRCIPPPTGALAAGAVCGGTMSGTCASGICANRLCTYTCALNAGGDAACRTRDPATTCAEFSQSATRGGPSTTFGACVRTCQRDADCPTPLKCGLSAQAIGDTLIRTCRAVFGTLGTGAACPLTPAVTDAGADDPAMYCASGQCFGVGTSTTVGYCAGFCATDADCPGPTYICRDIPFFRPSYPMVTSTVPIRMCERR